MCSLIQDQWWTLLWFDFIVSWSPPCNRTKAQVWSRNCHGCRSHFAALLDVNWVLLQNRKSLHSVTQRTTENGMGRMLWYTALQLWTVYDSYTEVQHCSQHTDTNVSLLHLLTLLVPISLLPTHQSLIKLSLSSSLEGAFKCHLCTTLCSHSSHHTKWTENGRMLIWCQASLITDGANSRWHEKFKTKASYGNASTGHCVLEICKWEIS